VIRTTTYPTDDGQHVAVIWRIDTNCQTMVLSSNRGELPAVIYWKDRLPADEDLLALHDSTLRDINGGMLDQQSPLSVAPQRLDSFPGQPGLIVHNRDGKALMPRLRFVQAQLNDANDHLVITYNDPQLQMNFTCTITAAFSSNVIALHNELTTDAPVLVSWLAAPVLPAPSDSSHTLEFSGRWCGEFQINPVPWQPGARVRECLLGRTSHEHFPGLVVPTQGCNNAAGKAYGFHYGWSGGHKMITEVLPDGRRQVQFGQARDTDQLATTHVATAPLYVTYSNSGLNGIARAFQTYVRDEVIAPSGLKLPRPVHYNCWEAVYFNHDVAELQAIATEAAALGAERFVLDDGWFKGRNDDTTSLGDWEVDTAKYPDGLMPLISHVQSCGMGFGLWFEPEMVNQDSDLYRDHPDWLLGPTDQIKGRNQWVLDLANQTVRDYLYQRIAALLDAYPVEYIKWDHNRVLPFHNAEHTQGVYQLFDRLREAYPQVEIESCSSGGGRIDFGILARTQRVWLSDSNDALERTWMQNNAALFLPSEITGSHVGPRHCHTSGRHLPMALRAWVAASRHMGFEMDPKELDEQERSILVDAVTWYKENRDWLHRGTVQRLDLDDPAQIGEIQVAVDQQRFVAFITQMTASQQSLPQPVRLTGLAPDKRYCITLRNAAQAATLSRGPVALKDRSLTLSGALLMNQGINLPVAFPETLWVVEGHKDTNS
jgi:alpha-galactosidase